MAYISHIKLLEKELDNIVSIKYKVQCLKIIQLYSIKKNSFSRKQDKKTPQNNKKFKFVEEFIRREL